MITVWEAEIDLGIVTPSPEILRGHLSKLHRREWIAVAILQTLMTTETSLAMGFLSL